MTITTRTLVLPRIEQDANVHLLARQVSDRITDVTGTDLVLANPVAGLERIYKNGLRLDPAVDYTLSNDGLTVTLSVAAIGADVFLADYFYRGTR
jgi:hypothetical protein